MHQQKFVLRSYQEMWSVMLQYWSVQWLVMQLVSCARAIFLMSVFLNACIKQLEMTIRL